MVGEYDNHAILRTGQGVELIEPPGALGGFAVGINAQGDLVGNFGLLRADGSAKPSFATFRWMAALLDAR